MRNTVKPVISPMPARSPLLADHWRLLHDVGLDPAGLGHACAPR